MLILGILFPDSNIVFAGIHVSCPGNPGHGSRFIENNAAEKLVSVTDKF